MKKTILILLASASLAWAQGESNLTVRVDVPDNIVETAKAYMWITGQTNDSVRGWLATNVVVTLPQSVTETVNTRKQDMMLKIQNATAQFLKSIANKFGY